MQGDYDEDEEYDEEMQQCCEEETEEEAAVGSKRSRKARASQQASVKAEVDVKGEQAVGPTGSYNPWEMQNLQPFQPLVPLPEQEQVPQRKPKQKGSKKAAERRLTPSQTSPPPPYYSPSMLPPLTHVAPLPPALLVQQQLAVANQPQLHHSPFSAALHQPDMPVTTGVPKSRFGGRPAAVAHAHMPCGEHVVSCAAQQHLTPAHALAPHPAPSSRQAEVGAVPAVPAAPTHLSMPCTSRPQQPAPNAVAPLPQLPRIKTELPNSCTPSNKLQPLAGCGGSSLATRAMYSLFDSPSCGGSFAAVLEEDGAMEAELKKLVADFSTGQTPVAAGPWASCLWPAPTPQSVRVLLSSMGTSTPTHDSTVQSQQQQQQQQLLPPQQQQQLCTEPLGSGSQQRPVGASTSDVAPPPTTNNTTNTKPALTAAALRNMLYRSLQSDSGAPPAASSTTTQQPVSSSISAPHPSSDHLGEAQHAHPSLPAGGVTATAALRQLHQQQQELAALGLWHHPLQPLSPNTLHTGLQHGAHANPLSWAATKAPPPCAEPAVHVAHHRRSSVCGSNPTSNASGLSHFEPSHKCGRSLSLASPDDRSCNTTEQRVSHAPPARAGSAPTPSAAQPVHQAQQQWGGGAALAMWQASPMAGASPYAMDAFISKMFDYDSLEFGCLASPQAVAHLPLLSGTGQRGVHNHPPALFEKVPTAPSWLGSQHAQHAQQHPPPQHAQRQQRQQVPMRDALGMMPAYEHAQRQQQQQYGAAAMGVLGALGMAAPQQNDFHSGASALHFSF